MQEVNIDHTMSIVVPWLFERMNRQYETDLQSLIYYYACLYHALHDDILKIIDNNIIYYITYHNIMILKILY